MLQDVNFMVVKKLKATVQAVLGKLLINKRGEKFEIKTSKRCVVRMINLNYLWLFHVCFRTKSNI